MQFPQRSLKLSSRVSRRSFFSYAVIAAAAVSLAPSCLGEVLAKSDEGDRELAFYNLHTDEQLKICYRSKGSYLPDSLAEINHFLRDFRTNEIKEIEPELIDLLFDVRQELNTHQPFHVISGYRSPATNAMLRQHSEGVARNSLHMLGEAIDIRIPGSRLQDLKEAATSLRRGGVGYYPTSNFVHVDVGRVRHW